MRHGHAAWLALALIGLGLVGCGRFGFERREAWRLEAEEACLSAKLVTASAYMSRVGEIDGPGVCGITYPFRATALAGGRVGLTNRLTLACPIIPEVDAWLEASVQPAAELYLGTTVSDIRAGSYSCRSRNNQAGAKLSEHAFGNALDVMSFRLADGREVSVEKGWRGTPEEQGFLREVFVGACRRFRTVLGPGSDVFHYNHLHLDLARHSPRGDRRICRPVLKFEPRLDPDGTVSGGGLVANASRPAPPGARPASASGPPIEIDDEGDDPYGLAAPPSKGRGATVLRPQAAPGRPGSGPPLALHPRLALGVGEE